MGTGGGPVERRRMVGTVKKTAMCRKAGLDIERGASGGVGKKGKGTGTKPYNPGKHLLKFGTRPEREAPGGKGQRVWGKKLENPSPSRRKSPDSYAHWEGGRMGREGIQVCMGIFSNLRLNNLLFKNSMLCGGKE